MSYNIMSTGVIFCSVCSVHIADSFCLCKHPLQALCGSKECREVHESKAAKPFHYPLPMAAKDRITPKNHFDYLKRLFALQHIQSRFIESLHLFDTAVAHIEESYKRQVMALTALRDQYIEKVARLREATDEAFRKAVNETTEHAVDCEHIPQNDISQWIWTMASKRTDDNIPLFHLEIREIQEKDMELMFAVRMNSMFRSLATWNFGLSKERVAMQKTYIGKLKLTVPELVQKTTHFECRYQILESSLEITQKFKAMSQEMEQARQRALIDDRRSDFSPIKKGNEMDKSRQHSHSPGLPAIQKTSEIISIPPGAFREAAKQGSGYIRPPRTPVQVRTTKRRYSGQNSIHGEAMDTLQLSGNYEQPSPTWAISPIPDAPTSSLQRFETPPRVELQSKQRTEIMFIESYSSRPALSRFHASYIRETRDLKEAGKQIDSRA